MLLKLRADTLHPTSASLQNPASTSPEGSPFVVPRLLKQLMNEPVGLLLLAVQGCRGWGEPACPPLKTDVPPPSALQRSRGVKRPGEGKAATVEGSTAPEVGRLPPPPCPAWGGGGLLASHPGPPPNHFLHPAGPAGVAQEGEEGGRPEHADGRPGRQTASTPLCSLGSQAGSTPLSTQGLHPTTASTLQAPRASPKRKRGKKKGQKRGKGSQVGRLPPPTCPAWGGGSLHVAACHYPPRASTQPLPPPCCPAGQDEGGGKEHGGVGVGVGVGS